MMKLLEVVKQSFLPKKAKQNLVRSLEKLINLQIEHLTRDLKNQKTLQKTIDETAREGLAEDLEKIKILR
jgi:hypothetical protein